jgi:hypothetical protein
MIGIGRRILIGRRGQSTVIEFLIFFIIGLTLFIGIGNFFKIQSDILRKDVSVYSVQLVSNYMSSLIIAGVDSCKQCDVIEGDVKLPDSVFGYYLQTSLSSKGLNITTLPPDLNMTWSIGNLNYSIASMSGSAPSIQTINLTYNRNENKLEIR